MYDIFSPQDKVHALQLMLEGHYTHYEVKKLLELLIKDLQESRIGIEDITQTQNNEYTVITFKLNDGTEKTINILNSGITSEERELLNSAVQPADIADMETKTDASATYQPKGDYIKEGDERLTDARTPLAHTHGIDDVTGLQSALDGKGTYSKPTAGIPNGDLDNSVQESLNKADTALQSFTETDPTVPEWAKQSAKPTYTADEVGALPEDTPIPSKTSELENDSNFVVDAKYQHTDNNYDADAKAEVAKIENKQDKLSAATDSNDGYMTKEDHASLSDLSQEVDDIKTKIGDINTILTSI